LGVIIFYAIVIPGLKTGRCGMSDTITLTLSIETKLALDNVTRQEGISVGDLVSEAIKEYLFLRQFRLLREKMIPKAQAQGIYTDQDIFDLVS
jgi:hypothetical protein